MKKLGAGRFADQEVEARFQRTARGVRLPFVRIYSVLFMLVALGYSVLNPQFVSRLENAHLAVLLGGMVLVSILHIALTYLRNYPAMPWIDFVMLFAQAALVTHFNIILSEHLIHLHEAMHAVGVINRLAISAFAAVALAGRRDMFMIWLVLDLALFMIVVLPLQVHAAGQWYAILSYGSGAVIMVAINLAIEWSSRTAFTLSEDLEVERARNESMIHNMLPKAAVERLRAGQMVADSYSDVSIVFIDMVGFSSLSKRVSPGHLVEVLNAFFSHADRCAARLGVEKVKTVGDAYVAIAGANIPSRNSADTAISFARAVLSGVQDLEQLYRLEIALRAGIHSGPVVGGVIGESRMAYDFWGDTVNIAARLEAVAPVGGLAISESTWLRTGKRALFSPPNRETLKGVGEICIFHSTPQSHEANGMGEEEDSAETVGTAERQVS